MSGITQSPPSLPQIITELETIEEKLKDANQFERECYKYAKEAILRIKKSVMKDK